MFLSRAIIQLCKCWHWISFEAGGFCKGFVPGNLLFRGIGLDKANSDLPLFAFRSVSPSLEELKQAYRILPPL